MRPAFLGANVRMQKERNTETMELSTSQDPVQEGFTQITVLC